MYVLERTPDHSDISLPNGQLTLWTFDRLRLHPSTKHAPSALHSTNVVFVEVIVAPLRDLLAVSSSLLGKWKLSHALTTTLFSSARAEQVFVHYCACHSIYIPKLIEYVKSIVVSCN